MPNIANIFYWQSLGISAGRCRWLRSFWSRLWGYLHHFFVSHGHSCSSVHARTTLTGTTFMKQTEIWLHHGTCGPPWPWSLHHCVSNNTMWDMYAHKVQMEVGFRIKEDAETLKFSHCVFCRGGCSAWEVTTELQSVGSHGQQWLWSLL